MSGGKLRANNLDGRTWTRYSISVWNDIRKNTVEKKLSHPALFPLALVERLLNIFTLPGDTVLDPFMGSGSTLLGAQHLGRHGVGLEISGEYIEMFRRRQTDAQLEQHNNHAKDGIDGGTISVIEEDARNIPCHIAPESVDFCLTSPPYWDILNARRTADHKPIRNYGEGRHDLGKVDDYSLFLLELKKVFSGVYSTLRMGKYCIVVVMDIRKKNILYPFHMDLSHMLISLGFVLDDMIIWDRRDDYNNLRPLGYPHVFRINKVHEFLLIFQKRPKNKQESEVRSQEPE